MNEGQLYDAVRSRAELAAHSIHVIAGCQETGTLLEVTHAAANPEEYQWKLTSRTGQPVGAGCVIGNSTQHAAEKIAEEVVGDVTSPGDARVRAALDDGVANPWATDSPSPSNESYSSNRTAPVAVAAPEAVTVAEHAHGFKHVMGRIGWWSGQILVDALYVAGGIAACAAID
jgi:hypothetical protein